MGRTIGRTFAILSFAFSWPSQTGAYYCDDNLCSSEQFCCGENICCNYVNGTIWRFVCLLISVIVLGFVVWGFVQLIMAMLVIYKSRHRSRDVEQDFGEASRDLSAASLLKHALGSLVHWSGGGRGRSATSQSASGASRTLISFNQTD